MKIPNKLPITKGRLGIYGQYSFTHKEAVNWHDSINNEDKTTIIDKYCGRITGKELSNYVEKACNNFPEAIDLLKQIFEYSMLPPEEFSDGEVLDKIFKLEINKFLVNLEL